MQILLFVYLLTCVSLHNNNNKCFVYICKFNLMYNHIPAYINQLKIFKIYNQK